MFNNKYVEEKSKEISENLKKSVKFLKKTIENPKQTLTQLKDIVHNVSFKETQTTEEYTSTFYDVYLDLPHRKMNICLIEVRVFNDGKKDVLIKKYAKH